MTSNDVTLIGWIFLVASWMVPYIMKKQNKENTNRYSVGLLLAAVSLMFFVTDMVTRYMK